MTHFTWLEASMGAMFVAVLLGLWLSSLYLMREEPPQGMVTGLVHGTFGAACVALLWRALQGPGRHGASAGKFGWTAFILLAAALAGGLTILTLHMRRRGVPPVLIAMHGSVAVAGAIILGAYYINPMSLGR